MVSRPIQPLSSSGSEGSSSRYQRITSGVSAMSYSTGPPMIVPCSPMSWQRNVNEVTMPKFPPPPRSAQNRSRVRVLAGGHERAVGEHHVGGEQVVDGQAEAAGQVADAAAQGQAGHPGGGQEAGRAWPCRTPRSRGPRRPRCSRRRRGRCGPRADRGAAQQRQVDDQRVVRHPQAGRVVPAAPHGDLDAVLAGEPHAGDDVGGVAAAGDRGRVLVDHGVVDGARLVVPGIPRADQVAAHRGGQFVVRQRWWCCADVVVMRAPPLGMLGHQAPEVTGADA